MILYPFLFYLNRNLKILFKEWNKYGNNHLLYNIQSRIVYIILTIKIFGQGDEFVSVYSLSHSAREIPTSVSPSRWLASSRSILEEGRRWWPSKSRCSSSCFFCAFRPLVTPRHSLLTLRQVQSHGRSMQVIFNDHKMRAAIDCCHECCQTTN